MIKIQDLREIIELIDDSSINEFTYETEGTKVVLKKDGGNIGSVQAQKPAVVIEQQVDTPPAQTIEKVVAAPAPEAVPSEPLADTGSAAYDHEIVSPMVGTLYSASSPGKDPFVTKGSTVTKDSVVCIVEAMKLFNEIEAEVTGEIVEVLVEDGELVEYGQPLFRVKTK